MSDTNTAPPRATPRRAPLAGVLYGSAVSAAFWAVVIVGALFLAG